MRTAENEELVTTSILQVALFSAALGGEAALSLAAGASPGAHAGLGGHAAPRRRSPPVAFPHHPGADHAARAAGSAVAAPHVPAVVASAARLPLAHRPRLLLLHVQTHLASKHDGPFYLGPKDSLHRIRVVEDHKAEVGQLSADPLGVDSQLHHVAVRHEELLELSLIDVMWEVADKKLVAVGVPHDPSAVRVTGFEVSSTFVDKT